MAGGVMKGAGGGSRRRKNRHSVPMAEINVTPFVDVMLVLLIVFMVTAPLLSVGVPIELPKTEAKQLSGEKEPLTVSVDVKGRIFLQETEVKLSEVVSKLVAIAKSGYKERIYVRGDKNANYGAVMKVMGTLSKAGFSRIALVTDSEESS